MKVVDVNLLLYATNTAAVHHARAKAWLQASLEGEEPIALPWPSLLAFMRLSTSSVVFSRPLTHEQALTTVDSWLATPAATTILPGPEHWRILRSLLADAGTAGNLTTDAHLAALAVEHGAQLCSTDTDFARFPLLNWVNPIVGSAAPR